MRLGIVLTIFWKELIETLRDRRTLLALVLMPVLIHPLLLVAMARLSMSEQEERKATRPLVVVWGELPAAVLPALEGDIGLSVVEQTVAPPEGEREARARALIDPRLGGRAHLVIDVAAGGAERFVGDEAAALSLWFDPTRPASEGAHARVVEALAKVSSSETARRFARHRLPARLDHPLEVTDRDLSSKRQRGAWLAGRVLPLVLLVVMFVAGLLPAIDLTAGEKERGTMQTLLCAPVRPLEIVAGKYLTVVLITLLGAGANLGAMAFALASQLAALGAVSGGGGLELSLGAGAWLAVFGAMVPVALLLSALLLALAVMARNFREANAFLTPVLLLLLGPALLGVRPGLELDHATALAPITNLMLLARGLLQGTVTAELYVIVSIANLAWATLAILLAARAFATEQVLLGGERPWRDVFGRAERMRATPSPGSVVLFAAVLFMVVYYGALWLAGRRQLGPVGATLAMELALILAPSLAWVWVARARLRPTLSLELPSPRGRGLAGALLLGVSAWAVGAAVLHLEAYFFPGARAYGEALDKIFGRVEGSTGLVLLTFALAPAIAEEVCFRGVLLSGLSNTGSRWLAVGGSALAFGLFHVNPYHIGVATVLGVVFGLAALESGSLLPGVLAHLINNALGVLGGRHPSIARLTESPIAITAGIAATALALWLLRRDPQKEDQR